MIIPRFGGQLRFAFLGTYLSSGREPSRTKSKKPHFHVNIEAYIVMCIIQRGGGFLVVLILQHTQTRILLIQAPTLEALDLNLHLSKGLCSMLRAKTKGPIETDNLIIDIYIPDYLQRQAE